MLTRTLEAVDSVLRAVLALLLLVMVAAVTWQVVSRYLLGDPSSWTEELARFVLIWIGLLGGAHAYRRRLHLGLDLLAARLGGRARVLQTVVIHGVVAVFAVAVLMIGGVALMRLAGELGQASPALGWPMAAVYAALPVSGALLVLFAAAGVVERHGPDGVSGPAAGGTGGL